MRSKLIYLMLGTSLTVAACATPSGTGTATGAVAGGVLGGAVGGTTGLVLGATAGGLLGYGVGRSIEIEDQRRIAYALEANRAATWRNPHTGYEYDLQPTDSYVQDGRPCRQFRLMAEMDGSPQEVMGTACRQPDGNWQVIQG